MRVTSHTDVRPHLHDEWERLGEELRREVCEHETLSEAIVDVLRRVYEAPAYCVNEGRSFKAGVYVGEDQMASHTWVDTATLLAGGRWSTATYDRGSDHSPGWTRELQVSARLQLFNQSEETLTKTLGYPCADTRTWRLLTRLTTRLWWEARLAEGYPPETACMMLGLLVPIETWQHLDFATESNDPDIC